MFIFGGEFVNKKILLLLMVTGLLAFSAVSLASANPSPNGPGQPGAIQDGQPGAPGTTCGGTVTVDGTQITITNSPPGQLTDAFLNIATQRYAGSPDTPSLLHANSPHAISQYDIACFQATVHGLFPP